MAGYGNKPFGLRDVKVTTIDGVTQIDLQCPQTLGFTERIRSGELSGGDTVCAVVAFGEALEWSLENGGISLEAYALMTGRTAVETGTTPTLVNTLTGAALDTFPYFKIYGKAVGDGADDAQILIYKAKLTSIEGNLAEGEFWITSMSGVAIDDGVDGIWDYIQDETATALPAT